VSVASAGPYASLHLAPDSEHPYTPAPTTQFFTGRMPFLSPNQQHQSTEGRNDFSIKSVKAFPTTFNSTCIVTLPC